MRISFLLLIVLILSSGIYAQQPAIYINEVMASNLSSYPDIVDFADFSDWIELYNDEDVPVDIGDFYGNPIQVELNSSNGLGSIHYTLDGFEPLSTSPLFSGSIPVTDKATIPARVFEEGKLPGKIVSSTFLIDEAYQETIIYK